MTIDLHVHSTYSDGADSLEECVTAAVERGITHLGFTDHVRRSTSWLPTYTAHVAALAQTAPIPIWCGIEAKILDSTGRLDVPENLDGVAYVAIADHQMPGDDGPLHPDAVAGAVYAGHLSASEVVERLVDATAAAALHAPHQPLIAHLFSLLPKVGLSEEHVPPALLRSLAARLAAAGAWVEANEKWRCPSRRTLETIGRAGVRVVTGSDAHAAGAVGRFSWAASEHSCLTPGLAVSRVPC